MSDKTEAFAHSLTRENLMRAFAGESQARNRYTIAAGIAHKAGLAVVEIRSGWSLHLCFY